MKKIVLVLLVSLSLVNPVKAKAHHHGESAAAVGLALLLYTTLLPFLISTNLTATTLHPHAHSVLAAQNDAQTYVQAVELDQEPTMTLRMAKGIQAFRELVPQAKENSEWEVIQAIALFDTIAAG